ncbi:unnamed protein product [Mucor hiemalis]
MVKEIWVVRHGFREDWANDNPPLPTQLRNDPPLSQLGREQSMEVANYLKDKSIDRIYSSPLYRVLETVYPLVQECDIPLHIDYALGEWYDLTHKRYLPCAPLETLKQLFPKLDIEHYTSSIPLPTDIETADECHARVKKGLDILIHRLDTEKDPPHTILLSGHAASAICAVRALLNEPLFYVNCGICSLSHLVRQPDQTWKIIRNGDCNHLSQGEQKAWIFSDIDYKRKK